MRRGLWAVLVVAVAIIALATLTGHGLAQQKKIVMWTHWGVNAKFNKWYETRGKDFAKKSGVEVEVVTMPFQGHEAKYLAALLSGCCVRPLL